MQGLLGSPGYPRGITGASLGGPSEGLTGLSAGYRRGITGTSLGDEAGGPGGISAGNDRDASGLSAGGAAGPNEEPTGITVENQAGNRHHARWVGHDRSIEPLVPPKGVAE